MILFHTSSSKIVFLTSGIAVATDIIVFAYLIKELCKYILF